MVSTGDAIDQIPRYERLGGRTVGGKAPIRVPDKRLYLLQLSALCEEISNRRNPERVY